MLRIISILFLSQLISAAPASGRLQRRVLLQDSTQFFGQGNTPFNPLTGVLTDDSNQKPADIGLTANNPSVPDHIGGPPVYDSQSADGNSQRIHRLLNAEKTGN